jgi:hypothetical protein
MQPDEVAEAEQWPTELQIRRWTSLEIGQLETEDGNLQGLNVILCIQTRQPFKLVLDSVDMKFPSFDTFTSFHIMDMYTIS